MFCICVVQETDTQEKDKRETGKEDNKDVSLKSERRRTDDIIDYIRDKYGWSEEITWPDAKWRLIDADVSRTFSIKPYFKQETGNEDNKDVAPKYERKRIDDIKDYITDKYGPENPTWNEAKWRLIDTDVSRTFSIKPYFEQESTKAVEIIQLSSDESAELVEDDKEDEVEDDKDQEEEDDNDEKEQDDNDGSDDETWTPKKEATSSSRRSKKKKLSKEVNWKEDDKKDVNVVV
nr:hypothetical protein [Tanacetum cinerariifolium]